MKIYVASSWRSLVQPGIVIALRRCGHDVYDFRNPAPGKHGFAWSSIDPEWKDWEPHQYRAALQHPIAVEGYRHDITALRECDACVLVLPSGRSASWEFGYAMGMGKPGVVVMLDKLEPELMYREAAIVTTMGELFDRFGEPRERGERVPRVTWVHVLDQGAALCGLLGSPGLWADGHRWIGFSEFRRETAKVSGNHRLCKKCEFVARCRASEVA